MRTSLLVPILCIALNSAASGEEVLLRGYATAKCGDALKLYELEEAEEHGRGAERMIFFFNAFLSGINIAVAGQAEKPFLALDLAGGGYGTDELRLAWLRSACQANPDAPIFSQAYRFWIEGLRVKIE